MLLDITAVVVVVVAGDCWEFYQHQHQYTIIIIIIGDEVCWWWLCSSDPCWSEKDLRGSFDWRDHLTQSCKTRIFGNYILFNTGLCIWRQ